MQFNSLTGIVQEIVSHNVKTHHGGGAHEGHHRQEHQDGEEAAQDAHEQRDPLN